KMATGWWPAWQVWSRAFSIQRRGITRTTPKMTIMRAIGLMSGTSMDGIDVASIETDGTLVTEIGPSQFVPYDAAFRRRIEAALETAKSIVAREDRPGRLAELEEEITLRHARAVS